MAPKDTLSKQMNGLEVGQVLNVSGLKDTGAGSTKINVEKSSSYFKSKTDPRIVSNSSNKHQIFRALDILGIEYDPEKEIQEPKTVTRGRTPAKTPVYLPGSIKASTSKIKSPIRKGKKPVRSKTPEDILPPGVLSKRSIEDKALLNLPEESLRYKSFVNIPKKQVAKLKHHEDYKDIITDISYEYESKIYEVKDLDDVDRRIRAMKYVGPSKDLYKLQYFRQLKYLDISVYKIELEIAAIIATLTNLTTLDVQYGNLGHKGTIEIAKLPNLTTLNISNNNLGPEGTAKIAKMSKLKELYIENNNLGPEGIDKITKMRYLRSLHVSENDLRPGDRDKIHKMKGLRELSVSMIIGGPR